MRVARSQVQMILNVFREGTPKYYYMRAKFTYALLMQKLEIPHYHSKTSRYCETQKYEEISQTSRVYYGIIEANSGQNQIFYRLRMFLFIKTVRLSEFPRIPQIAMAG